MAGNPFGHGIPSREGSPIQLVRYEKHGSDEFGKIYVVPEALEILQRIKEPVAVIAVVGSYRRGKSWFANALHGRHDGFELGAQVSGCTRGIYMWDTPFVYEGKRVVALDTEGIDDPNQEAEWATKLFILCLVLSSTFIYNINGVVGSGDVGKLFLMQDLSRYIQPPEDSKYLPHLVILLRDFGLERPDSLKNYFLNQLAKISREAAEGIKKSFKEFSVFALPHPGVGGKRLQQMQAVSTHDLEDEFVEETVESVKQIYRKLEPKYIGHLKMNGLSFAKFLTDCVEKMNDPENHAHLSIPNEYETVTQYVAQSMRDRCLGLYRKALNKLAESIPMPWDEFNAIHQTIFEAMIKEYVGGLVGTLKQIEGFKEKFQCELEEAKKPYQDKNSKELYAFNIGHAKTLWNQLVEPGLKFDQLFAEGEFREALENFEQQLRQIWIESPEAMEALKYYKENYYKSAIDTLTNLNVFNEKLAGEMKEREKLHEQYLELAKKEMELNNKLEERDQQMQTIKETLDAKSQAIQEAMKKQQLTEVNMERLKAENQRVINDMRAKHAEDMARLQRNLQETQRRRRGICTIL